MPRDVQSRKALKQLAVKARDSILQPRKDEGRAEIIVSGGRQLPLSAGVKHTVRRVATVSLSKEIIARQFRGLDERWSPTVEALIDLVVDVLPEAQHERKWGRLTFTRGRDWHHWICAISPTKTAVKLVIHTGSLLADPRGVMVGEGKYSRTVSLSSPEGIDADVLVPILREAAARQTEM